VEEPVTAEKELEIEIDIAAKTLEIPAAPISESPISKPKTTPK